MRLRDVDQAVGCLIADRRRGRNLTQKTLAELMTIGGVTWSQQTANKVETGYRSLQFLEAVVLASALGVDVTALIPSGFAVRNLAAISAEKRLAKAEADLNAARAALQEVSS